MTEKEKIDKISRASYIIGYVEGLLFMDDDDGTMRKWFVGEVIDKMGIENYNNVMEKLKKHYESKRDYQSTPTVGP